MTTDNKLIITPDEAESLLQDGETVHNFAQAGFAILGCDYDRAAAIKAFREAKSIEIGGSSCKGMKHPIVIWDSDGHYTFFEADMDKVAAFEASRLTPLPTE